ncbi:MAG TPA: hypothetical protein VFL41_11280 [Gaiellaceae bacterium]|nr:hypothetical protein [Gaiellaceae bacterium]
MRLLFVAGVALATLALPAAAPAAPPSTTFSVTGFEYAFTPTVGVFAGIGRGNAGDSAAWNTRVEHDPLGSEPTYINGGSFKMVTVSKGGHPDYVRGDYVHHGGTITTIDPGANCTNQRFRVVGALEHVSTTDSTGGIGSFSAVLTHHRLRIFGRCFTYSATVAGGASFSY